MKTTTIHPKTLRQAVGAGDIDVARSLLDAGADANAEGYPVLQLAAEQGDPAMIQLLVARGAALDGRNPRRRTALMIAAARALPDAVEALLALGCDADARDSAGTSALMFAAQVDSRDAVLCVKKIADKSNVSATNNKGRSALHVAADHGALESVEFLARVADLSKQDENGQTAFVCAMFRASSGFTEKNRGAEILGVLMQRASPEIVNAQDNRGRTALVDALKKGLASAARALTPITDCSIVDEEGKTALNVAAAIARSVIRPAAESKKTAWELVEMIAETAPDSALLREAELGLDLSHCPRLGARTEAIKIRQAIGKNEDSVAHQSGEPAAREDRSSRRL